MSYSLLSLCIIVILTQTKIWRFNFPLYLVCCVIGGSEMVAQSIVNHNSLEPLWRSPVFLFETFLQKGFIFYFLGLLFIHFIDSNSFLSNTKKNDFYARRTFYIVFFVLLLSYVPVFIVGWPYGIPYDTREQYTQVWDSSIQFSNHHPVFSTIWMGWLYGLGKYYFGNEVYGIFLSVLVQAFILIISISYLFTLLEKYNVRRLYQFVFFIILRFSLLSTFILVNKKDVLFTGFFIGFIGILTELVLTKTLDKRKLALYCFYSLFCCFFRHTGIYVVLPTTIILFFFFKLLPMKQRLFLFAAPCLFFCWVTVGYTLLNVRPISGGERLSIPFLQVARVVRDHSDNLSAQQKQIIDEVLIYDKLPEAYRLTNKEWTADAIKFPSPPEWNHREGCYRLANTPDEIKKLNRFLWEWGKMAFEYPQSYIEAFFIHSSPYFTMYRKNEKRMPITQFYNELKSTKKDHYLSAINVFFHEVLLCSLFSYHACFVWLLLWCAIYLLKFKRKAVWIPLTPVFLLFITCLLSPSSGSFRYFVPISCVVPFLVAYVCILNRPKVHNLQKSLNKRMHNA